MPTEMLSPHFTLDEFLISQTAAREGISNQPSPEHHENLKKTAAVMEQVRTLLGSKPIIVSSGYRSPDLNRAVGGATSSAHCYGFGCDFTCPGFGTPVEIANALLPHLHALGVDQIIHEFGSWVHIGLSANEPRMMALTIDNAGTRVGIV